MARPPSPRIPCDTRIILSFLSIILFLSSLIYFFFLPARPLISQSTYVDEHALIQLQHHNLIGKQEIVERFEEWRKWCQRGKGVYDGLSQALSYLPLSIHSFNHTQYYSFYNQSHSVPITTRILYAVWRAPKSQGAESLLLSTVFSGSDCRDGIDVGLSSSDSAKLIGQRAAGVGILFTWLKFMTTGMGSDYFSRDLLFVAVESNLVSPYDTHYDAKLRAADAFGAWIDAYHSTSPDIVRAGSIVNSFTFTIPSYTSPYPSSSSLSSSWSSFSLDSAGHHGVLPNLDLPTVTWMVWEQMGGKMDAGETTVSEVEEHGDAEDKRKRDVYNSSPWRKWLYNNLPFLRRNFYSAQNKANERSQAHIDFAPIFQAIGLSPSEYPFPAYFSLNLSRWKGLWRFMLQSIQSGRGYLNSHAGKYGIDAVSIRAVQLNQNSKIKMTQQEQLNYDILAVLSLESLFRSLNNLIEKFHHSTYWYLLNVRNEFVTMSKYVYAAVLLIAILPLNSLFLLFQHQTFYQDFKHSIKLYGALYLMCLIAYFSPSFFSHYIGHSSNPTGVLDNSWNELSITAWSGFVALLIGVYLVVLVPRWSRLQRGSKKQQDASIHSIEMVHPLYINKVLESHTITSSAAASPSAVSKLLSSSSESVQLVRVEIPSSPYGLPSLLLIPPSCSPSPSVSYHFTSLLQFESTYDWRILHALISFTSCAILVPIMVLNFSICFISALVIVGLWLNVSVSLRPGRWWKQLKEVKRVRVQKQSDQTSNDSVEYDYEKFPIHSSSNYCWELLKYLYRRLVHLLALVLFSPFTFLLIYAQFHHLTLHHAFYDCLQTLPGPYSNLIFIAFFFAYLPSYIAAIMAFFCNFEVSTVRTEETELAETKKEK